MLHLLVRLPSACMLYNVQSTMQLMNLQQLFHNMHPQLPLLLVALTWLYYMPCHTIKRCLGCQRVPRHDVHTASDSNPIRYCCPFVVLIIARFGESHERLQLYAWQQGLSTRWPHGMACVWLAVAQASTLAFLDLHFSTVICALLAARGPHQHRVPTLSELSQQSFVAMSGWTATYNDGRTLLVNAAR